MVLTVEEAHGSSGLGLPVLSFSKASGVLSGFSGASGLEEASSKGTLGLRGEPSSEAGGLWGSLPEASLGLGGALGGGGRLGGADILWIETPFLLCLAPSLAVRVRMTTCWGEGCSVRV